MILNHLAGLNAGRRTSGTGTFSTCVDITATGSKTTGGGYAGFTVLTKFQTAVLAAPGTVCRITFQGPSFGSHTLGSCYIGQAATSGNAYNFDGGQVQVTFGGSGTLTLGAGASVLSDIITFSITQARPIIVAWQSPTTPASNTVFATGLGANYVTYYAASTQEAASTSKVGTYSVSGNAAHPPFLIEVA